LTFSAEDFAKALAAHDYDFRVGSQVKGKVVSWDNTGAAIDIGGKSAAFLPAAEASLQPVASLDDVLEADSERDFLVIRDQDADGQVLLSIRRLEIQALWEELTELAEAEKTLEVVVTGHNRGGVTVDVNGLRGFVPRSHLSQSKADLADWRGTTLTVGFLEVNPSTNKLVLSQRQAARSQVMGTLERGQLIAGTVVSIKPFGVFVEFDGVTGLLHIKQISQNYVESLPALFQVGQPMKAVVVDIDDARNRISLSTKVLEKYPGEMAKEPDAVLADAENRLKQAETSPSAGGS